MTYYDCFILLNVRMDTYCNSYNTIMISDHCDCFLFMNVHMHLWLLHTDECVYTQRNSYDKIQLNDLWMCICIHDCFIGMIVHMYTHRNTYNKILLDDFSWLLHECECTFIHKLLVLHIQTVWQIPLKMLHPQNPPNLETQIVRYKFKLNPKSQLGCVLRDTSQKSKSTCIRPRHSYSSIAV